VAKLEAIQAKAERTRDETRDDTSIRVRLTIEGVAVPQQVTELRAEEALDGLWELDVAFQTDDEALDPRALAEKAALCSVEAGDRHRLFHGVITGVTLRDAGGGTTSCHLTLRPLVWLLSQGRDCRIFQELTAPQVVAKVLAERGVEHVRFALLRSYAARDLCVQFRESDWDFIQRLLEEEGLFYFFEHEEARHVLVISDGASVHADHDAGALPLVGAGGGIGVAEGIESFVVERHVRPGRVTVRSVELDNPSLVQDDVATRERADLEVYEPSGGRAEDRLDALRVGRDVASGVAQTVRLGVGGLFQLRDHPRASLNRGWMVTSLSHRWSQAAAERDPGGKARSGVDEAASGGYECRFRCIPDDVPWRPAPRTPRPRMAGPQAAEVVGPEGTEIHTDEAGRVLVRMRWDRATAAAACWVHVSQTASGAGFGAMTLPRVGSSVLVEFIDGDPDQPIVVGRVYNKTSPYPYTLPADKTKTTLRTRSTPGGDGYNELRFEDSAGAEEVYLRAQRDLGVVALRNASARVGGTDELQVASDQRISVGGSRTTSIAGQCTTAVGAAESTTVGGDQRLGVDGSQSIDVVGFRTLTVGGKHSEVVVGRRERLVQEHEAIAVQGDQQVNVGGTRTAVVAGGDGVTVGANQTVSVAGNAQHIVDGELSCSTGSAAIVVEGATSLYGVGAVKIESATAQQLGAPSITVSGDTVTIRAYAKLVLEAGSSSQDADDRSRIEITPDGVYVTNGNAKAKLTSNLVKLNC
jgi:type VI secretion system secreted protein VgrG